MRQNLLVSGENYKYVISAQIGGISFRLLENINNKINLINILTTDQWSTELQGFLYYNEDDNDFLLETYQNILIEDSPQCFVTKLDKDNYIVQGTFSNKGFTNQLNHILYVVSEEARITKLKQCTLHAAAVKLSEYGAVLILGDKGSGKTITTYALCKYEKADLIGNDLTILGIDDDDSLYLKGGSTQLLIRKNIFITSFPGEELPLGNKSSNDYSDYYNKLEYTPNELGINVAKSKITIKLIVRLNVHPYASNNIKSNTFPKNIEALRLHELLGRYIRGQTTPMCLEDDGSISGYLHSLDSPMSQEIRNRIIRSMFNIPFVYITSKSPQNAASLIMDSFYNNKL